MNLEDQEERGGETLTKYGVKWRNEDGVEPSGGKGRGEVGGEKDFVMDTSQ